jgi:hypothetical protein
MKEKHINIASVICLIVLFLGLVSYSSKITNPFIGLKGLVLINSTSKDVVQISTDPVRYIGRSDNVEGLVKYMNEKGYNAEQLGSQFSAFNDTEYLHYSIEGFFLTYYYIYTELP